METLKRKLADWLTCQSEKQQLGTKKTILFGLCLFLCAYATGLVIGAISYELQKPGDISRPTLIKPTMDTPLSNETAAWYISRFRQHMDSLEATPIGRMQRDTILQRHPGIMDTIARLEQQIDHIK